MSPLLDRVLPNKIPWEANEREPGHKMLQTLMTLTVNSHELAVAQPG
jgi:hypothetical protein